MGRIPMRYRQTGARRGNEATPRDGLLRWKHVQGTQRRGPPLSQPFLQITIGTFANHRVVIRSWRRIKMISSIVELARSARRYGGSKQLVRDPDAPRPRRWNRFPEERRGLSRASAVAIAASVGGGCRACAPGGGAAAAPIGADVGSVRRGQRMVRGSVASLSNDPQCGREAHFRIFGAPRSQPLPKSTP